VIEYLTKEMSKTGISSSIVNVRGNLSYRNNKFKIPSFKPTNLVNTALALIQFKRDWRKYFYRTTYAFSVMTKIAQNYIERNDHAFDIILQSGVIFSAGVKKPGIPYFLYLDNTTAIYERCEPVKDLPVPIIASTKWKAMEKRVYEMADRIFTMSNFVQSSLISDYGISQEKIRVIGAGPNLETIPQHHDKSYRNHTLLFVGKDFKRKGGEVLLKAFQRVRKEIRDAKLIIVGPKKIIQGPGIIYKGLVDYRSMPALYREASIFVLPSLREPFGLSFLEAMAHQLPCIGTDIQAIPEIIEDRRTGFVVPAFSEDELAEKIIMLLKNEDLMKRMGTRGLRKVKENYTWDLVSSRILSEFRDFVTP